jgi:GntR family transcriptional regulator
MAQQPMYQQIAEDLRKQIESGALAQGNQLPTEIDLRAQYGASRNTIRDAVKRLTGQGLIETKPGQGTFVTKKVDPFVTILTVDTMDPEEVGRGEGGATYLSQVSAEHRKPHVTPPRVEVQEAHEVISRRLRVPASTQVVSRHEQRFIDDIPWSLQTSFYPMEYVTRGAELLLVAKDIQGGAVRYLTETIGLKQVGYREWITARSPNATEQAFFRISHDSSVFENFRTAFDEDGKAMRVTVTVFPTDRNQFIVNVGDVPDPEYSQDDPPGQAHEPA